MSLRSKIILILSAVMAIYVITDFIIQRLIVLPGFNVLEAQNAETDALRVKQAIEKEVDDLDERGMAWSMWDEMYDFVETKSERFQKANLQLKTLANRRIDLMVVCDVNNKIVWNSCNDPDTNKPVALRDFSVGELHPSHPCVAAVKEKGSAKGLLLTEKKPILISARPILTSAGEGSARGIVIVGRFISNRLDVELTEQTRVPFDFWQMDPRQTLPAETELVRDELTASARPIVKEHDNDTLYAYCTLNDFRGRPDFLIRADVKRHISQKGVASIHYALISTLAAGFIILLVLMTLLQKTVLSPLSLLTRHAVAIGKNEDFRAKLKLDRNDELGVLSREFNDMMIKLEAARAAIVETARTAGKSEIATGILHNVGNLLNSVNISASVLSEKVNGLRTSDLEKLADVLRQNANDVAGFIEKDPRGKHVQPVLSALSQHLGSQKTVMAQELGSLTNAIECIRELVKSQQSFAVHASFEEPSSIPKEIEKAVQLTDRAGGKDRDLKLTYQFADVPDVIVDKFRILEILVNVIQNARQAMDMAEGNPKNLTIAVSMLEGDRMRITITDTGVGISNENLCKIFNLGFTTKPQGHGFGLHSAANSATEMGGSLTATSEGPGKGATFKLEFPVKYPVSIVTQ
ncbi:MAG: CHASE4 domain-containing protein [Planctomycetota bacterium]